MDGVTPFLHRAEDYAASRPPYPAAVISFLKERCGLEEGCRVLDAGSGTGIFSRQLLKAGATVFAVEPNSAMRAQAEASIGENPSYVSLDAPAEELPFDDAVIDIITCAQSFHWFDREKVKAEFGRVLHGAGWVCCFWNSLDQEKGGASEAMREAFDWVSERSGHQSSPRPTDQDFLKFFAKGTRVAKVFRHLVEIPLASGVLLARSRSYWPDPESDLGREAEALLMEKLKSVAVRDKILFQYKTELYAGQMD